MNELKWIVKMECRDSKSTEPFFKTIAAFRYLINAEDFINSVIPRERRLKCKVEIID
ncbi:MAG: hypothetical protein ACLSU9_10850 [Anaerovoracaceae bacterium]